MNNQGIKKPVVGKTPAKGVSPFSKSPELRSSRQEEAHYISGEKVRAASLRLLQLQFEGFKARYWGVSLLLGCFLFVLAGCRTAPLPPVNLSEPGWKLREGQAVWRRGKQASEIAGEVQIATHPDGRVWLQFTKSPIPLVVGQITSTRWQIQFVSQNRTFSGPGQPPSRLGWLQLARAVSGAAAAGVWVWQQQADGAWRLENPSSGEVIEGYLAP